LFEVVEVVPVVAEVAAGEVPATITVSRVWTISTSTELPDAVLGPLLLVRPGRETGAPALPPAGGAAVP
jgi:hypothetical protein